MSDIGYEYTELDGEYGDDESDDDAAPVEGIDHLLAFAYGPTLANIVKNIFASVQSNSKIN